MSVRSTLDAVMIARRIHLFPYRTQKLSSLALMILGGRPPGKVGRCRLFWSYGQAVKTPPFHGGNPGSIPGRITRPKPDFLNESQVFLFVGISMKASVFNGSRVRFVGRNKKNKPVTLSLRSGFCLQSDLFFLIERHFRQYEVHLLSSILKGHFFILQSARIMHRTLRSGGRGRFPRKNFS